MGTKSNSSARRLLVLYDGSAFGGLETHVELFVRHVDRRRYEPHVLIPERLRPVLSPALLELLRSERVEVSYTVESNGRGRALAFAKSVREIGSLGCEVAFVETCTAIGLRRDLLALRLAGLPIVRILHMPASAMINFYGRSWAPWQVRALDRLVARNLVLTDSDHRELESTFGLSSNKIEICRQGQDFEHYKARQSPEEARRSLGLDPGVPCIGLIGRFTEQKGHPYFIEAASRLVRDGKNVRFLLVGRGEDEQRLRDHVAELGLSEQFVFAGFQRDVRPWIEACDIMTMPSLWESAPMVLLECLAMQRPMVASDLACFRELVGDSTCRLVTPKDSGALADALSSLLADTDGRGRLAQAGASFVRERFDIRRHVGQIMSAFDRAAERGSRASSGGAHLA